MNGDSSRPCISGQRLPDALSLLPEQDVSQCVERFAAVHQVTFERTALDE